MSFVRDWFLSKVLSALEGIARDVAAIRAVVNESRNYTRRIMALVSIEQSVLDAFGTTLQEIADNVQEIVDDPSNDLGPADVSGITGAVTRLQELVAEPESPVEPTPEASEPN